MTTIELVASILGSGVVGSVATKTVEWQSNRHKREATQETLRETFAATLIAERKSLAAELADERKATDEARGEHGDCLEAVAVLRGEVAECKEAHRLSASDARSLRERVSQLEKRTSDPNFPRVA